MGFKIVLIYFKIYLKSFLKVIFFLALLHKNLPSNLCHTVGLMLVDRYLIFTLIIIDS